jgi:hypothetical protein
MDCGSSTSKNILCTDSPNSHQNSHSSKTKMAADLAAPHLAYFIVLLAPQVGLEPTTLRLTAGTDDNMRRFLFTQQIRGLFNVHAGNRAIRERRNGTLF